MVVRVGDVVQDRWSEMAGGFLRNQRRRRALFTKVACALTTDVLAAAASDRKAGADSTGLFCWFLFEKTPQYRPNANRTLIV